MWLEAIFSKDDLVAFLPQFTPVRIRFSEGGDLYIHDPSEIHLVAGAGVEIVCKANVHWPVLGIKVPITLHSVRVLARPQIAKIDDREKLVFPVEIVHADFAGIPDLLDNKITERMNRELAAKHAEAAWDFMDTLSFNFALPATLEGLKSVSLRAAWGEVKVTEEALALAVSFQASVARTPDASATTEEAPASAAAAAVSAR